MPSTQGLDRAWGHKYCHVCPPLPPLQDNPYESIDPAPSAKKPSSRDIADIHVQVRRTVRMAKPVRPVDCSTTNVTTPVQLTNQALPLFERYQAMFSLRNNGSKAAVLALTSAFTDPSPLFRHEVAYVLGQLQVRTAQCCWCSGILALVRRLAHIAYRRTCALQHAASIPALKARIDDPLEHEMVRHEAAEALGAIGTSDAVEYLAAYKASDTVMLRESCEVALDAVDYWATTN